jgi:heme exporter protein D
MWSVFGAALTIFLAGLWLQSRAQMSDLRRIIRRQRQKIDRLESAT